MRLRTEVELEGRMSPMEPKGWRAKAQTKAWKSVVKVERRLTKVELEE